MSAEYRVISIGTLSKNRLWGETAPLRTAHATTSLVVDAGRSILVDPSLPAPALAARFFERTGKDLASVTDVFCTTLRPVHRRSIAALGAARWWCAEAELEAWRQLLGERLDSADRLDAEEADALRKDLELLGRFRPAPEQFTPQVSLYPLVGPSPGGAGLLVTPSTLSVVIAGDAALTADHVQSGQVWEGSADLDQAAQSLRDLLELADVVVPGHDNVLLLSQRWL